MEWTIYDCRRLASPLLRPDGRDYDEAVPKANLPSFSLKAGAASLVLKVSIVCGSNLQINRGSISSR